MEPVWFIVASVGSALLIIGLGILYAVLTRDKLGLPDITEFVPSRIPIHLMPSYEIGPRVRLNISYAIAFWNKALGGSFFIPLGELVDGGSVVSVDKFTGEETPRRQRDTLAYVVPYLTESGKGISSAAMYIDTVKAEDIDDTALGRAIAHELGHVLGLAHDDVQSSVMYKKVLSEEAEITSKDIAFLKDAYRLS